MVAHEAALWIDRQLGGQKTELCGLASACGRILQSQYCSRIEWPPTDLAAIDGYAVSAHATAAAAAYDPVVLRLGVDGWPVRAASPMPPSTDAVVTADAVTGGDGVIEIVDAIAPGTGVDRAGSAFAAGACILPASRRLQPQDLALLAAMGESRVDVRPRLAIAVRAGRSDAALLLRSLCAQGGAVVDGPGPPALILATNAAPPPGEDAVAVQPGGHVWLHVDGGVPVLTMAPDPLACLVAFDVFVAPVLRHRGAQTVPLARKIVSGIGTVDHVRVRLGGGVATPIGMAGDGGLASAVRADGYVIVPEGSEGIAAGEAAVVHIYGP